MLGMDASPLGCRTGCRDAAGLVPTRVSRAFLPEAVSQAHAAVAGDTDEGRMFWGVMMHFPTASSREVTPL
jgi:hypothetical protein